jgi:stage II sporulation protein AA (anti-sigma F factor antagonist)
VGTALIVRMSGELDLHTVDPFRRVVDEALSSGQAKDLVLALKGVTFIDSSGIGAILGRYRLAKEFHGTVVAVGPRPAVRRVLEMAGVFSVIGTADTERQALARLSAAHHDHGSK